MSYREFSEEQLPQLTESLNELVSELLAEKRENLSWNSYGPAITPEHCEQQVTAEALVEIKRKCAQQGGFLDPLDQQSYPSRARHSGDANYMSFKQWLKNRGLWKQGRAYEEISKVVVGARHSGTYWYPENGYMGWHTNENHSGQSRLYCNYAAEDRKSFFRFQSPDSDEIVTSWDRKGWVFRYFEFGDTPETRLWHCVYSSTDRLSFGFKAGSA